MLDIVFVSKPISRSELGEMARNGFGDFVKAVADISKEIMALNAELHADEEQFLIERHGSRHEDLWGFNLYPDNAGQDWIEFDSLINIRPSQGNRSRNIENKETQDRIRRIVAHLIKE